MFAAHYYDGYEDCEMNSYDEPMYVAVAVYAQDNERADRRIFCRPSNGTLDQPNNVANVVRPAEAALRMLVGRGEKNVVHVFVTHGTPEEKSLSMACARFAQQRAWYHRDAIPLVLEDDEYLHAQDN